MAEAGVSPTLPARERAPVVDGVVVVDKPQGWTSHDVVARVRRLAGTRKVGHAGTLDPMATGVLVLGIGRATRLLGHLALTEKQYTATIRLGETTTTDDAEGVVVERRGAATVTRAALAAAMSRLTGEIDQVPSSVSAIKVAGRRAYDLVRSGESVELAARRVSVSSFEALDVREGAGLLDVDVTVTCSSGTYVRALARDLGEMLGCGGHLTALRRTRVGAFGIAQAASLDALAERFAVVALGDAVAASFPRRDVDDDQATAVRRTGRLPAAGLAGPYGVFGPDGTVLALMSESGPTDGEGLAKSLVVFAPAS